jgi:hypothetical protein
MSPNLRLTPNLRLIRNPALAALACVVLTASAVAGSAATASPAVRGKATCVTPKYPGAGYFTDKIHVTNVSCAYAKKFVVAYYRCRTHSGRSLGGRCRTRVQGFKCTENRKAIATEIDARVTCRRVTQRIVHSYQQNLE